MKHRPNLSGKLRASCATNYTIPKYMRVKKMIAKLRRKLEGFILTYLNNSRLKLYRQCTAGGFPG